MLTGNSGDDNLNSIKAGAGNDRVAGLGPNDTFDGGDGVDTITFAGVANPVTLTLAAANVTSNVTTTGNAASGKILNFENVIGTDANDVITGNLADNVIFGGVGDDTLDGGMGNDTLSFAGSVGGVSIDLTTATVVSGFIQSCTTAKLTSSGT